MQWSSLAFEMHKSYEIIYPKFIVSSLITGLHVQSFWMTKSSDFSISNTVLFINERKVMFLKRSNFVSN